MKNFVKQRVNETDFISEKRRKYIGPDGKNENRSPQSMKKISMLRSTVSISTLAGKERLLTKI
jgi:hypothetical protein